VSTTAETHGFRYAPGLDGIRALAVFAVVCYHLGTTSGVDVLPGGFLGVDIFFVLSGYLITSLLIAEARKHGRISIKQFYLRRARRLLPALYALLLIVGGIGAIWLPQQAARLRGDLLAALGYATNWWLVAQNSSYFTTLGDRPPLLTHLWSLAVEEQYYLIWPLILIVFFAIKARRRLMLTIVLAGVAASTIAAWVLYDPYADPSRVYYGTDTRALAPLLGAALAIAVQPWKHRSRLPRRARHLLDVLGVGALLALTVIAAVLRDTDDALYRGGFLVIAALGAIVVGVGGHPGTALGEMLGTQPLRWIGERSYAIYLWHWPVCVLTRPGVDVPITGWANAILRIALALLLAEISYHLIETPIRRNGFLAPLRAAPKAKLAHSVTASRRAPVFRTAFLAVALVAGGSAVGLQLSAAGAPVAGGPIDAGPDLSLGPLVTQSSAPSASASASLGPPLAKGAKVAFFGDSQGHTLLLNKPVDLGKTINAIDSTIEGCGVVLGRIEDQKSHERRNLNNCSSWPSTWASRVHTVRPAVAVIMIGAWDVFDLGLDSGNLTFASAGWDAYFIQQISQGIDILRNGGATVAISLLPCYAATRPDSVGVGAGWWPQRSERVRTSHVNDLLRQTAATYADRVFTLDPPPEFCTDPVIGKSDPYRWDGIHYSKPGAQHYFRWVLPQLFQP
jgi:peptidoglycan/LPS O-acetylase OafA/YrhL